MRFVILILAVFALGATELQAQSAIIFSKSQHDFGQIAPSETAYQQDFLFRNTSEEKAVVKSAITSSSQLQVIHTRSDIHPGEYGFVKIKLKSDNLDGLFNEFVEVNVVAGDQSITERIYVRAEFSEQGIHGQERSFTDSEVALTVEVSPDDVEDMEGFMGDDKLNRAETEISYLRRQLKLQSALLFRYNEDLKQKQLNEEKNLEQLAQLEEDVKSSQSNEAILSHIDGLSARLQSIRDSDLELRKEFSRQEEAFDKLRAEADSARNYAEQLSHDLQERFKAEAEAIERAQELEAQLANKQDQETQQRRQIDSLNAAMNESGFVQASQNHLLDSLQHALAARSQEQALQEKQARLQSERLERLHAEKNKYLAQSDSLAANADAQQQMNRELKGRLAATEQRISTYRNTIDSLEHFSVKSNDATAEIDSLRVQLAAMESQDQNLQSQLLSQRTEIERLEATKGQAEQNLQKLERAANTQQQEAQKLMVRINSLSNRESQARLEARRLKEELSQAQQRETNAQDELKGLQQSLADREGNIKVMEVDLAEKQKEVEELASLQGTLNNQLNASGKNLRAMTEENDSLSVILESRQQRMNNLQAEITSTQRDLLLARQEEEAARKHSERLTTELESTRLSGSYTFKEMKDMVVILANERDDYQKKLADSQSGNDSLRKELGKSIQRERSAKAFAAELAPQAVAPHEDPFIYRLTLPNEPRSSRQKQWLNEQYAPFHSYTLDGKTCMALGHFKTMSEAEQAKKLLKQKGYGTFAVVAFDGKQAIPLENTSER